MFVGVFYDSGIAHVCVISCNQGTVHNKNEIDSFIFVWKTRQNFGGNHPLTEILRVLFTADIWLRNDSSVQFLNDHGLSYPLPISPFLSTF